MIFMLVVVFMLLMRARDPNTWRWLTNESLSEISSVPQDRKDAAQILVAASEDQTAAEPTQEPVRVTGPTDQDSEELDAAREEFQAISDKAPMQKEEMPAYWRLVSWVEHQPLEVLQQRARSDLLFTHLVEAPDKYRGQIIHVRLHLARTLSYEAEANQLGIKQLYEAWGYTDESRGWPYVVVFSDLPPGMPIRASVQEEASFYGYFLKTMSYEAFNKRNVSPVLIGRIVWHPLATRQASTPEWFWVTCLAGGFIAILLIGRWIHNYISWGNRPVASPMAGTGKSVEAWLERAQNGKAGATEAGKDEAAVEDDMEAEMFHDKFDQTERPDR